MEIPQTGGTFILDPETGALTRVMDHTQEAAPEAAVEQQTADLVVAGEGDHLLEELAPVVELDPPATPLAASEGAVVETDPPADETKSTRKKVK